MKWRKDFNVDELIKEDLGGDLEKVVFMRGHDKEGHPMCYNFKKRLKMTYLQEGQPLNPPTSKYRFRGDDRSDFNLLKVISESRNWFHGEKHHGMEEGFQCR
ncbi:Sec14p-like phosphatidylinositol transfer family protein [Striga asiatica]|uniref:Sec14p-like phosphatidylinositol transfer family protein n=1 Tax=Striga asiatica TaxID=4170 RepID=A0A5A7QPX5_STRAF|nr:Sec14p-like phosphatidylinositol transfer family protein [Striga asiatica]